MKKVIIAALALSLFGGAAFAQKTTPQSSAKHEVKQEQEVKHEKVKHEKHVTGQKIKKERKVVTETKVQTVK